MRSWREIDFPVKRFATRFSWLLRHVADLSAYAFQQRSVLRHCSVISQLCLFARYLTSDGFPALVKGIIWEWRKRRIFQFVIAATSVLTYLFWSSVCLLSPFYPQTIAFFGSEDAWSCGINVKSTSYQINVLMGSIVSPFAMTSQLIQKIKVKTTTHSGRVRRYGSCGWIWVTIAILLVQSKRIRFLNCNTEPVSCRNYIQAAVFLRVITQLLIDNKLDQWPSQFCCSSRNTFWKCC